MVTKKKGIRVTKTIPKGYRKVSSPNTAPAGYNLYAKWSLFDGSRKRVLVKQK